MLTRIVPTLGLCLLLALPAMAQRGVIAVDPTVGLAPKCHLYIGPEMVLTFSRDAAGRPFVNVINYSREEVVFNAEAVAVHLADGRTVHPTLLKIATGIAGDNLFRSYFEIHPRSSFYFELDGLAGVLDGLAGLQITIYPYTYRLESTSREFFDVLLERLERISYDTKSIAHAYRKLDIPARGSRSRVEE